MTDKETLRYARNILLTLHKSLIDFERAGFEKVNGPMNAGLFLNTLLENENFGWLRKFSMLIVEIDEMFDLKDGATNEMIQANLTKIRDLVSMSEADERFRAKYQFALQNSAEAAGSQGQLQALLSVE
jgi:hypothetical protein